MSARVCMAWPPVGQHNLQIVGAADIFSREEYWLPECSCGWIGEPCGSSAGAQQACRLHLWKHPDAT